MIHTTAIVSPNAQIGQNVKIGPYSVINDNVIIGDNTEIFSNVYIDNGARIGKDCKIFSSAIIATAPQDLKYNNEETFVYIGDRTVIREFATINRATAATGKTIVGSDCLLMTYCHVAHDCVLGDHVIMANLAQLAGHVHLEDWVILGGLAKIIQFCTVGKHSMIGADVKITKDVLPYGIIGREPAKVEGVNRIGLKRRGFSDEVINEIQIFYDTLFNSGYNTTEGIEKYKESTIELIPDITDCLDFIENSKKGIYR